MRTISRLAAGIVIIAVCTLGAAPAASSRGVAATPGVAAQAAVRSFSCTGIISRDYTRQTVNGTLDALRPSNVSVLNYLDTVLVTNPAPRKANRWWDGYWKTTYHLNQWAVGRDASGNAYHLMLPDTPIGGTFEALLVTEFRAGGNWQNWMDCTAV